MDTTERLRLWLLNDEGLYALIEEAATNTPDWSVDYVTEGLEIALGLDTLTPFQLEFMPDLNHWKTRDMIADLIAEQHEADGMEEE